MIPKKLAAGVESTATFLNVGARILVADIMDQIIRKYGNYRTHYAADMAWALKTAKEKPVDVLITELDLPDGSAYRLIQKLRETQGQDLYVILAVEEKTLAVNGIADELGIQEVVVRPFTGAEVKKQIELYTSWALTPDEPWKESLAKAKTLVKSMLFGDAEKKFAEAVMLVPGNFEPVFEMAKYFCKDKHDFATAEKHLKKVLEMKPNYVPAISLLGQAYWNLRRLDDAETCLKLAQKLSPMNPDRAIQLVQLYIDRQVELCRAQAELHPWDGFVHFQFGKVLVGKRDFTGAARALEKALPHLDEKAKAEAQTYLAVARKLGGLGKV